MQRQNAAMKSLWPVEGTVLLSAVLWISQGWAQSWTQTTAPPEWWISIACSADASRIVVGAEWNAVNHTPGSLWTSTNAGITWTQSGVPGGDASVACSADGNKMYASSYNYSAIYVSTNQGSAWNSNPPPSTNETIWNVVCSADGSNLVAAGWYSRGAWGEPTYTNLIYTSTNSGESWQASLTNGTNNNDWFVSLASSADGRRLVVGITSNDVVSALLLSTTAGATWTTNSPGSGAASTSFPSVACSADASTLMAARFGGQGTASILVSTNAGVGWNGTNIPGGYSVASSADGKLLFAAGWGGGVYTSTNSGCDWLEVAQVPGGHGACIASSADGCKLFVAMLGRGIYILETPPHPELLLNSSGSSLHFSWVVPSIAFVLQECSDLGTANWTDVTVLPILNYTNLHHEVSLPVPSGPRFYRLAAP